MSLIDTEEELGYIPERRTISAFIDKAFSKVEKGKKAPTYMACISRDLPCTRTVFYYAKSVRETVAFQLPLPYVYYVTWGVNRGRTHDIEDAGASPEHWTWHVGIIGFSGTELLDRDAKISLPHLPNFTGFNPCQGWTDDFPTEFGDPFAQKVSDFFWSARFNYDYGIQQSGSPAHQAILKRAKEIRDEGFDKAWHERFPEWNGAIPHSGGGSYPEERKCLSFFMAWESMDPDLIVAEEAVPSPTMTMTLKGALAQRIGKMD